MSCLSHRNLYAVRRQTNYPQRKAYTRITKNKTAKVAKEQERAASNMAKDVHGVKDKK